MLEGIITLIVGIVILTSIPLGFIWSLNTLFPVLAIPYDIYTWAASVLLLPVLLPGKPK